MHEWQEKLFSPKFDKDTVQAERSCIVSQHQTFIEYFVANKMDLSLKLMGDNQSLLDFMAEKIQNLSEKDYLKFMHELYLNLRSDNKIIASNSISLLNQLGFPFSKLDLSIINVNANFNGAICHKTNFTDSNLNNISLGIFPSHESKGEIKNFLIEDDQNYGATINNKTHLYNINTHTEIEEITLKVNISTNKTIDQYLRPEDMQKYAPIPHFIVRGNNLYFVCSESSTLIIFNILAKKVKYSLKLQELPDYFELSPSGNLLGYLCHYSRNCQGKSYIKSSIIHFYDLARIKYANPNKKILNVCSYLHSTWPLLIQKLSDNIISIFSLTQKKFLYQISCEDKISEFAYYLDNIYILSDKLYIYDLITGGLTKAIELKTTALSNSLYELRFSFKSEFEFLLYNEEIVWQYPSQEVYKVKTENGKKNFIEHAFYFNNEVIIFSRYQIYLPIEVIWNKEIGDYDVPPEEVETHLLLSSWNGENLVSQLSGQYLKDNEQGQIHFCDLPFYYLLSHAGKVWLFDKNNKSIQKIDQLNIGNLHDIISIPEKNCIAASYEDNSIIIYSLETKNKIAQVCHHGLYKEDEHFGVYNLQWNSQLNILYSDANSGIALWHFDGNEITLLYDTRHEINMKNIFISENTIIDKPTKSLLALSEKITFPKITRAIELTKAKKWVLEHKYLSYAELRSWDLVSEYLSYKDKLNLSCVNKQIRNELGKIRTTENIETLRPSIKNHLNQFLLNNFHKVPKDIKIKPSKNSSDTITVEDYEIPIDELPNICQ